MKRLFITLAVVTSLLYSCKKELKPTDAGTLVPRTVDENASLPSISVNGTQLHSEAFGDPTDPMLVFLHGGPGADYRNALHVANLAAHHYYIVFYDQRGCGLSKRHPQDSYSVQLMLDDLSAVIRHYRRSASQKVFLFGHSWGAMLATAYMNKYPAAITGAVLAEPGGFSWEQLQQYDEKSQRLKLFNEATNDVFYHDQFLSGAENEHTILDYKLALTTAYTWSVNNVEGIEGPYPFWRNGAAVLKRLFKIGQAERFDFRTNLSHFTVKVLFLYSENNRAYGEGFARTVAAAFPYTQIARVNKTGHEMIYFKWDAVQALVLPYLDSLR